MGKVYDCQRKVIIVVSLIALFTNPISINAQDNNSDILILDSETSIVLPYFDTSSIANSNIDAIALSLYVLDKTPEENTRVQITINPVDLNTNVVEDGLSTFVDVRKDSRIDLRLPKELFEEAVHTQRRFLVHLVSDDQRIVLKNIDPVGATDDPMLTVEHSNLKDNENPDEPQVIENNYYTIENAQLHFGEGDNIENNKIETSGTFNSSGLPLWLEFAVAFFTIAGVVWGVYVYYAPKKAPQTQIHSQQDNTKSFKIKFAEEEVTFDEKLRSLKMDVVKVNAHDHMLGVRSEYAWIEKNYPGSKTGTQTLMKKEFKANDKNKRVVNFDVIEVVLPGGREKDVYFEIDSFFAEGKPSSFEPGFADNKLNDIYSV